MEPALFALSEDNDVRNNVIQIFSEFPPNLKAANSKESLIIALAIIALKTNFNWVCNSGPGRTAHTCTNWQLLLSV